jgi:zinc D-Ala-D-Ala dipeptidase
MRNPGLLIDTMRAAGFVNDPTEWWHWSYGDRYWANLPGKPAAIFAAALSSGAAPSWPDGSHHGSAGGA